MGVEPVSAIVGLAVVIGGAIAVYVEECERENQRRRRQEEDCRRWERERRKRERDARRMEKERKEQERREEIEREERYQRERLRLRRQRERSEREEADEQRRLRRDSLQYNPFQTLAYYKPSYYYEDTYDSEAYENCNCPSCRPKPKPSSDYCACGRCGLQQEQDSYWREKVSVAVTIVPPQTTQDKNQSAKNQRSSNKPSSNSSQGATTSGNASMQNTNAAPKNASAGNQQPQRNNNNNNNNNNSNNKKVTAQDYGKLNDFIKVLKAILDNCKVSEELRTKILSFFNNFQKHEENFLRILGDFRTQNVAIEDILSIVIKLFQSDYFSKHTSYQNLLALMEIVAKYITDELLFEMVQDSLRGNKKPPEKQREECMKKVLQRDISSEITALVEKIQKEIVEDNTSQPLNPDFSGIFTKLYHYLKHKVVRGKEWTVKEYFDCIRKLLILLKNLTEYAELTDVSHDRREIVFEMYSTVFGGYFRLVVRAYGPVVYICTFFVREKRDKKAKDGDTYVDGKKKT